MEDWNWETIGLFRESGIFNHCDVGYFAILVSKAIEFGEKRKKGLLRRSRSFKVIEVGTIESPSETSYE